MDYHVYTLLPEEWEESGITIVGADEEKGEIAGGDGLEAVRISTNTASEGVDETILLSLALRGEYPPQSLISVKTPFGTFSVEDAVVKTYLVDEENTLWVWEAPAMFEAGVAEEVVVSGNFLPDNNDPSPEDIYENLLTKLGDIVNIALRAHPNIPVLLKYEDGPEHWKNYVALYPTGVSPIGRQYTSTLTNENRELSIQSNYEARVQFTFVGNRSFSLANTFNVQITTPLVREELARRKISVFTKGRINPTPQKRETKWVEGFSIDIRFGFAIETRQLVDTIDTVTIDPQVY